jgi:Ras-related protein Rab-2A
VLGFEHLRSWLADVRAHADPQLSCILVGNKTDLCGEEPEPEPAPTRSPGAADSDPPTTSAAAAPTTPAPAVGLKARAVPRTEAAAWADSEGLLFVEASAKSGAGVERAFVEACRDILHKVRDGKFDDGRVRVFPIREGESPR